MLLWVTVCSCPTSILDIAPNIVENILKFPFIGSATNIFMSTWPVLSSENNGISLLLYFYR